MDVSVCAMAGGVVVGCVSESVCLSVCVCQGERQGDV